MEAKELNEIIDAIKDPLNTLGEISPKSLDGIQDEEKREVMKGYFDTINDSAKKIQDILNGLSPEEIEALSGVLEKK